MDIFIIIVLVVAAVILFLVELFIVPGISIAGFLAGGCIIYANYYAFTNIGTTAGFIQKAERNSNCRNHIRMRNVSWLIFPGHVSLIMGSSGSSLSEEPSMKK